ncbi:hypothetical protein MRX96_017253 [Rhipicephalus microplus]
MTTSRCVRSHLGELHNARSAVSERETSLSKSRVPATIYHQGDHTVVSLSAPLSASKLTTLARTPQSATVAFKPEPRASVYYISETRCEECELSYNTFGKSVYVWPIGLGVGGPRRKWIKDNGRWRRMSPTSQYP